MKWISTGNLQALSFKLSSVFEYLEDDFNGEKIR